MTEESQKKPEYLAKKNKRDLADIEVIRVTASYRHENELTF
jgi:hypothetical protein